MPPSTIRIAALILPPIQLLDLSPIDLFAMLSKEYLTACNLPAPLLALGLDNVELFYVGEHGPDTTNDILVASSGASTSLAETTASVSLALTHNFSSPAVQPGKIDVLFVPGPDPRLVPSEAAKTFIRGHAACESAVVMSVCTGIYPLAHAGILDGRSCTGPRALLGMGLIKGWPSAKWVEKRWAVDVGGKGRGRAELWTCGGITNGQDMVAAFLRTRFQRELADLVCAMADVGGRGEEYDSSKAVDGMWWGWLLLRSWIGGLVRGRDGKGVKEK